MFLQGFHFCTTLQCKKKNVQMFQILQHSDYKLHFVTFCNTLCLYPVNEHPRDEKGLSFTSSKRSTFHNSEIMTMTVNPPPLPNLMSCVNRTADLEGTVI